MRPHNLTLGEVGLAHNYEIVSGVPGTLADRECRAGTTRQQQTTPVLLSSNQRPRRGAVSQSERGKLALCCINGLWPGLALS